MASYQSPQLSPCRGHYIPCKVYMLDDTVLTFDILPKSLGRVLFDAIVTKLQLLEADYFDLEYLDSESVPCWLDHEKPISKQMNSPELVFRFLVKFYTPDPELLEEELTRYLFALQIKRDLATGALFCQEHTAVLLASFVVQAEVGNYNDELADQGYLSNMKLLPNQTMELEYKIMEHHKEHIGETPAEADFNLLDTARKVEVYGIRMHQTKDHDGITLQLSVTHAGIIVFQNFTKINSFSWAKIRKLCFKRKKFIIKLHADGSLYSKDSVEFYFPSRNWSKNFWKRCIEYHAFFRCHSAQREAKKHRSRSHVVSRGSSFRYSGRTQKELVEFVRDNYVSPAPFERSTSMRTMSALNSRASTPRSGTLNSHRDLHFSSGALTAGSYTMASGSRTLDRSCPGSFDRPAGSMDRSHYRYGRSSSCDRATFDRSCPGSFDCHRLDDDDDDDGINMRSARKTFRGDHVVNGVGGDHRVAGGGDVRRVEANHRCEGQMIDPSHFMLSRDDDMQRTASLSAAAVRPSPSYSTAGGTGVGSYSTCPYPSSAYLHNSGPYSTGTSYSMAPYPIDTHSLPRSPEMMASCGRLPRPDHIASATCTRTPLGAGRPPIDRIYRQERFDLTPGNSTDQSSPPIFHGGPPPPVSARYDSFRHGRLSRDQRGDTATTATTTTSKSTASGASLTLTSSASIMSSQTDDSEDETKRKVPLFISDTAHQIVKELLMTERTYKKDLEIIAVKFQDAMSRVDVMPDYLSDLLFGSIGQIYEFHCSFIKEVDQRLAIWESSSLSANNGFDMRRIGDLLLANMTVLQWYRNHLDRHEEILGQLDIALRRQRDVQRAVEEFESLKLCYLPLTSFFIKPYQRLLHYQLLLERLVLCYGVDHVDIKDCKACLALITAITEPYSEKIKHVLNWQKLVELQRDLTGIDNIVQANRAFVREGCLQKLSRKGLQQRMFFLFSDILVYASRVTVPKLQFKVHGQLALNNIDVSEGDASTSTSVPFSFSLIVSGNRCLVLSADSQTDKDLWIEELSIAIQEARASDAADQTRVLYPSLKSNSSSEAVEDCFQDASGLSCQSPSPEHQLQQQQLQQRANTVTHVCWHRNTTVGVADHHISLQKQLSGYLLRKFKNSNGWQKLWVVFANFCLFFYKTFQDDFPLASLPLLGYSISYVSADDGIRKDNVFKLYFHNHVYYFRADSDYSFQRWVEVISSAALTDISPVDDLLIFPSPPPPLPCVGLV